MPDGMRKSMDEAPHDASRRVLPAVLPHAHDGRVSGERRGCFHRGTIALECWCCGIFAGKADGISNGRG